MNLEDELRAALERREPPPGFAARVLARAEPRRKPVYRWAAWAAAAGLLFAGGLEYRRQAEGERAKQQTMLALRTAAQELNAARAKVMRIDFVRPEEEER